jgi:hypothetical protein
MSTYDDNPPGPGNRDIAGMDSEVQFRPLPRKYPSLSNPVVYRPHGDGTGEILTHIATVDLPAGVR